MIFTLRNMLLFTVIAAVAVLRDRVLPRRT